MTAPTITALPAAPSRTTDPTSFVVEADAFLGALPTLATEVNAMGVWMDATASGAATSATNAAASATIAQAMSNMWPDTTTGLANTPVNGYFCVPDTGYVFATLYQNVAGVAVQKGQFPTANSVTRVLRILVDTDSLGYGTGSSNPGTSGTTGWPARMAAALTGYMGSVAGGSVTTIAVNVRNHSLGGSYSGSSYNRLTTDLLAETPQLVLLMDTPNDARADVRSVGNAANYDTGANFRKMVGLCRIYGATPVIITSAPIDGTMYLPSGVWDSSGETYRQANCATLRALATELGVQLIDVDLALSTNQDFARQYTTDGIHWNDAGHNIVGTIIARGMAAQVFLKYFGTNLAKDTFTRANSTTTMGTTETGSLTWTPGAGTWGISGNTAYLVSGANVRTGVDSAVANHEMQSDILLGTNAAGVTARNVDASNALGFYYLGSGTFRLRLVKWVAGTPNTLASTPAYDSLTGTHNLRLSVNGSVLTGYLDGTPVLTYTLTTAEAAIFGTATKVGLYAQSPGAAASAFDNVIVRTL